MTKQESIYEVAKTLFLVDKVACYNQLNKINFDEIRIQSGINSDLEIDIKNLMLLIALEENIYDLKDINVTSEINRVLQSKETKTFYDRKLFAAYLIKLGSELLATSKTYFDSYILPEINGNFVPSLDVRDKYNQITTSDNTIKDDIVKLINLNSMGALTKERLVSFAPDSNSKFAFLKLNIQFGTEHGLFDLGADAIKELLLISNITYNEVFTFISTNLPTRGLSDTKIQDIILLVRQNVSKTSDELLLDKIIIMHKYRLTMSGTEKIDILKELNLLIIKYTDLNIDVKYLDELKNLKGL